MTAPVQFKKLAEGAHIPKRATSGAAGFDLCALCGDEPITVKPMQRMLIPTGLSMQLPSSEYVGLVFARSGLSLKQGLAMANGVGVIDSDYRGELCVPAINLSGEDIVIENGQRIAQLVIMPVCIPEVQEAAELCETTRGSGGFGSTG